jgi:hypothetical protein
LGRSPTGIMRTARQAHGYEPTREGAMAASPRGTKRMGDGVHPLDAWESSGFRLGSSPEHFEQRAELASLRNSSLRPLAVTVLPVAFAGRRAATRCAAVQTSSTCHNRRRVPAPPDPIKSAQKKAALTMSNSFSQDLKFQLQLR